MGLFKKNSLAGQVSNLKVSTSEEEENSAGVQREGGREADRKLMREGEVEKERAEA